MKIWSKKLIVVVVTIGLIAEARSRESTIKNFADRNESETLSLVETGVAMDGGSIINDIRFADGKQYHIVMDFPFEIGTNKLVYPKIHFTVFVQGDWAHRETLEWGSIAEAHLIRWLEIRSRVTTDRREKKNATSLIMFLKDRSRPFPFNRRRWFEDSPWSLKELLDGKRSQNAN